jgi:hypothetical protein
MDPAVAAIVGGGIGASATLVGSVLNARNQVVRENASWLRERKESAYSNAVRSILRARNRRSALHVEEGKVVTILSDIGTFFDDLVDAQHWLSMLTTACSAEQRPALLRAGARLDAIIDELVSGPSDLLAPLGGLSDIYEQVLTSARQDMGQDSAGRHRWRRQTAKAQPR